MNNNSIPLSFYISIVRVHQWSGTEASFPAWCYLVEMSRMKMHNGKCGVAPFFLMFTLHMHAFQLIVYMYSLLVKFVLYYSHNKSWRLLSRRIQVYIGQHITKELVCIYTHVEQHITKELVGIYTHEYTQVQRHAKLLTCGHGNILDWITFLLFL